MGEGCGILVLEMADYVLTGSRSKLQAVVTLSEGLRKRGREGERERAREIGPLLLIDDDDCWLLGWGRGQRTLTAVSQPWTLHGDEASCQILHLDLRVKLWP